jgi:hypothetical protein
MPFSIQRYEAVMTLLLIVLGTLVAVVATGFVVETLRQGPEAPDKLYWATNLPIQYTQIDGNRIRYIKTGSGPNLVLLHTLRTQLDVFEKIVPTLAKSFTVYALDYPGHGFSDIPKTDYARTCSSRRWKVSSTNSTSKTLRSLESRLAG